jgi:hypothetical protein
MGIDVGHDDLLVHVGVAFQEIRVARVVVDDHLVDPLEAEGVSLLELLEVHAEAPMRIAGGETSVGRHLIQLPVVQDLEQNGEEVQAVGAGMTLDLLLERGQPGREAHRPLPRNSLIDWWMSSLLSILDIATRSSSGKASFMSSRNCPVP